ncbi:uncharacterized protein Afti isoform X2 [Maniola hyperantus]|uniref:uncharacterized protein Afti isoform X2 n=1 Tax=Aphantopus hyperantus TaxID=2795564 RepID=UPI003749057A
MSIPPLVCSTPPPPEQCDDDKDHEEFDITYISQEDDEDSNEYNYGNYSSYNIIYQATSENVEKDKWNANLTNVSESKGEQQKETEGILNGVNFITTGELAKESRPKLEESVVEDLNLIVNKDLVHSNDIVSKEIETEASVEIECTDKQTRIQDEGGTNISIKDENTDISVSTLINKLIIPDENEILDDKNEEIQVNNKESAINDVHDISLVADLPEPVTVETEEITLNNETEMTVDQNAVIQVKDKPPVNDDFGDFEDFQFTSNSENCQVLSVNSENPWENPEDNEGPEFGDFTANFDFKETKPVESIADDISSTELKTNTSLEDDNDDFGDFDDFRSSDNTETVADTNESMSAPDVTLWNVNSSASDLQIVDSINTVLTSIFANEIPEPENELLGKLESCLSVTWGHLIDIEVRQPYMVNWNNSLGQKTLLKALCIDSRNILFGPKWNYNMPKYAVNLTVAPLQPQKQFTPGSGSSSNESAEKVPNKEAGAWVDPFTPDGQEYTYAEALLLDLEHLMATLDQMAHKHSTLKISELLSHACNIENKSIPIETAIRPTDLDVFEKDTSTKLSKIYSSTINVQPVRHINLPDTHIFTPTDSETPRSKTIHYDSGPSGLIPQPVLESKKYQLENSSSQLNEAVDKEYWDFQDFKGSNTVSPPTNTITQTTEETVVNSISDSVIAKASATYQTQILQPIKLDPVMPTLNWPDPGEVKETFDDFSDFISSTSWNIEKDNHASISLDTHKDINKVKSPKEEVFTTDNVDDEFETFQFSRASSSAVDFSLSTTVRSQISLSENLTMISVANCDNPPVKVGNKNSKKSNSVILSDQSSSTSNIIPDVQDVCISSPQTTAIQNFSADILQPTSASSSGLNRLHKSDQILQPLSLESYSQINWPNPGIDLQDLSRFNPINSLHSLKSDSSTSGNSKNSSPAHNSASAVSNQTSDDDIWGDFVSSAPKQQHPTPKKTTFADDDEWTDFVSSPSMKPQNGLNTISFNVHTNLSMQKSSGQNNFGPRNNQIPLEIPTLNYITPKSSNREIYSEKHFQNL